MPSGIVSISRFPALSIFCFDRVNHAMIIIESFTALSRNSRTDFSPSGGFSSGGLKSALLTLHRIYETLSPRYSSFIFRQIALCAGASMLGDAQSHQSFRRRAEELGDVQDRRRSISQCLLVDNKFSGRQNSGVLHF